ncbi:MAG TPA: Cd(II)/Pb(II)-responsive transcriptional regulator [Candidatus Binataceae bacterium]|nr:Cd(II)/Pb(II)-responsive transcriptional regulator [Candidatus Binataceae bacterium]
MRIGQLAARAGCGADTVRYYERAGLLAPPQRHANGYRRYAEAHLERLAFIRRCRSLDMSLPEIRMLLAAMERPEADCDPVNALIDAHIVHVAARIEELKRLKAELDAIRAYCCGAKDVKSCGILASLARPARAGARAAGKL